MPTNRCDITVLTAPSSPTNLNLSMVSGNSMVLTATWSVPDPANGVLLNYTITCNGSISVTFPAPAVTVTVAGLQPYTVYSCSVVARTNGGVGDASNTAEERTAEDGKDHQCHGLLEEGCGR